MSVTMTIGENSLWNPRIKDKNENILRHVSVHWPEQKQIGR